MVVLWLMVLLSAILFNLSFFFSNYCGFLVLFFWIPLFYALNIIPNNYCCPKGFSVGFVWGFSAFSFNVIWLYILLLTKSNASLSLATILYLFMVLYVSMITAAFFAGINYLMQLSKKITYKLISFFAGLFFYFNFLIQYSLIIFGRLEGYPFINPLIPLVKYKLFIFVFNFLISFFISTPKTHDNVLNNKNIKIFYLKPVEITRKEQVDNPHYYGQKIYHGLSDLDLFKYKNKYKKIIIVSPESTFPFAINKHLDQIDFWSNVLPGNAYVFLGTMRTQESKTYQSISIINKGLIIDFYDKTHLMPFVEELNLFFNQFSWAKNIFLNGKNKLCQASSCSRGNSFLLDYDVCIIPQICSEFFFNFKKTTLREFAGTSAVIFLFVNDSWFVKYFRKIMKNMVYLRNIKNRMPILYITHEDYEFIF